MMIKRLFQRLRKLESLQQLGYYLKAVYYWARIGFRFSRPETVKARWDTCRICPRLYLDDGQERCRVCKCYVTLETGLDRSFSKLYFPQERCPINKWIEEPRDMGYLAQSQKAFEKGKKLREGNSA